VKYEIWVLNNEIARAVPDLRCWSPK